MLSYVGVLYIHLTWAICCLSLLMGNAKARVQDEHSTDSHVFFLIMAESASLAVFFIHINFMLRKLFSVIVLFTGSMTIGFAQKTDVMVDYMESSARYLEPTQSIMTTPLIADLSVIGGQISYTETEAFKDYEVTEALIDLVPSFKAIALCHAARTHKADMIIGAMVDVITNDKGRLEITITGYPARYVNFRNATDDDMNLVRKGMTVVFDTEGDVLSRPGDNIKVEETKKEKK